jgi:hypothetical protein
MRPPESTKLAVAQALEDAGITLSADDPARRDLELGFLAAERRAFDTINARLQGNLIETPVGPEKETGITVMGAVQRWAEGGVAVRRSRAHGPLMRQGARPLGR